MPQNNEFHFNAYIEYLKNAGMSIGIEHPEKLDYLTLSAIVGIAVASGRCEPFRTPIEKRENRRKIVEGWIKRKYGAASVSVDDETVDRCYREGEGSV